MIYARPVRTLLAALLLLAVVGCGSSSGSGFTSATEVAQAANCGSITKRSPGELELFAASGVTCILNDHELTVLWFKSKSTLDSYRRVADQFGGAGLAYGDDWAVECHDDEGDCAAFSKAVG